MWPALVAWAAVACATEPGTHTGRGGDGAQQVAEVPFTGGSLAPSDAATGPSSPVNLTPMDAGADARVAHDTGIGDPGLSDAAPITVAFAEWLAFDYISCGCNNDPRLHNEMCLDLPDIDGITQDMICNPICATKGGLNSTGAVENSDLCSVPKVGGPDSLACHCADGYVEHFCADVSCFDASQHRNLCDPYCAPHGGFTTADCIDYDYDGGCVPKGHNRRTCDCIGGKVAYCMALDCQAGVFGGENCRQACNGRDALVSGCTENDPACP